MYHVEVVFLWIWLLCQIVILPFSPLLIGTEMERYSFFRWFVTLLETLAMIAVLWQLIHLIK